MGTKSKHYLVRVLRHHARLFISIAIGFATALLAGVFGDQLGIQSKVTRAIICYDVGTCVYLFWSFYLMYESTTKQIRARALAQDDGKAFVLIFTVISLIFATSAIFAELGAVKSLQGAEKYGSFILALTTIMASWFFTATIFALHYAHDYYFQIQHGNDGGLIFLPADADPSYWDFMYFSLTIAATAQTADVTMSSTQMRKTCTLQAVLAFFFNTTLLALAINMAAGLL